MDDPATLNDLFENEGYGIPSNSQQIMEKNMMDHQKFGVAYFGQSQMTVS